MNYSIDWPPGFKSRTSTPGDACYIGDPYKTAHAPSAAAQFHFNTPNSKRTEAQYKARQVPYHFVGDSAAKKAYDYIKVVNKASATELAGALRCTKQELRKTLLAAIQAGVIHRRPGKGGRYGYFDAVYSIGPVLPKGES